MTKLALITDTHFGARGDKKEFLDNMELFYTNTFFPEVRKRNIKHLVHLGDVFDNRKRIDVLTARRSYEMFFKQASTCFDSIDIIAGNHDIYYRESLSTTALEEFIDPRYMNISVHKKPVEHNGIAFVPWIAKENTEEVLRFLDETKAKYVFGHFELNGHSFSRVQVATHGLDPSILKKFNHVYSGHYHYRHTKNNITYLGAPTEMTWMDAGVDTGFHIFDTETGEIEFIPNPHKMFRYINMEDGIPEGDLKQYIRVNVNEGAKETDVVKFTAKLEELGAINVKTIKTKKTVALESETADIESSGDSALDFIRRHSEDAELLVLLEDLYNEASVVVV